MISRYLFIVLICTTLLLANRCPDQYNPELFSDSSEDFISLIDESFEQVKLFGSASSYKKLNFVLGNDGFYYKPKSFVTLGEYKYPIINGLWAYHVDAKSQKVDQVKVALKFSYQMKEYEFFNDIVQNYGGLWQDFEGDSTEKTLSPDFAKVEINYQYATLKVQLYGMNGDATKLSFSVANFWLYDYGAEVKKFRECKKN